MFTRFPEHLVGVTVFTAGSAATAVAACRAVGITRKTGDRLRAETGGIPSPRLADAASTGRYLSLLVRQRIATFARAGWGSARSHTQPGIWSCYRGVNTQNSWPSGSARTAQLTSP